MFIFFCHRTQHFAPWETYLVQDYGEQIKVLYVPIHIVPNGFLSISFVPLCRTSPGLGNCPEGAPLLWIQKDSL